MLVMLLLCNNLNYDIADEKILNMRISLLIPGICTMLLLHDEA